MSRQPDDEWESYPGLGDEEEEDGETDVDCLGEDEPDDWESEADEPAEDERIEVLVMRPKDRDDPAQSQPQADRQTRRRPRPLPTMLQGRNRPQSFRYTEHYHEHVIGRSTRRNTCGQIVQ